MNHFLDIGGNIGQTFDWYLLKTNDYDGFHVWCFEPSVRSLEALRQRCLGVMADNTHNFTITVCPFALSDYTGFDRFYEKHQDALGDSLYETTYAGPALMPNLDTPIQVMCGVVNVAEFISRMIPPEDRMVLKVDTEGSELKIVKSVMDSPVCNQIDKMLVEFHAITGGAPADEAVARIKAAGIAFEFWTL